MKIDFEDIKRYVLDGHTAYDEGDEAFFCIYAGHEPSIEDVVVSNGLQYVVKRLIDVSSDEEINRGVKVVRVELEYAPFEQEPK